MRFFLTLSAIILSAFSIPAFGEVNIVECKTQEHMEEKILETLDAQKGKKILVVFDVDMVLTHPSDPSVQMGSMAFHREALGQLLKPLSDQEKKMALTLAATASESQLVSQKMPSFIKDLNSFENVYTVGLTAFTTGAFQAISSLEQWRVDVLNNFGIHLGHKDFPDKKVEFSSECSGRKSLFLKGLIFCDDVNNIQAKPENLLAFFEYTGWVPEVVVFIDDRDKYLHAVGEALQKAHPDVAFRGLHYKQAFAFPESPVREDEFRAKWEEFVEQGKELARAG